MTDKAPNLQWKVDRYHHVKTNEELDHDKLLNDAIENEDVRENLKYLHERAYIQAARQNKR